MTDSRRPTDNCLVDLLVTANYLQLSPTDEPTSSYDAYTTYPLHQGFTARRWPLMAAPALLFLNTQAHASIYTYLTTVYTRAPMTSSLLYIHVSLRRTVQFHLPHMYIIISNIYSPCR